jgi:hypothetical protein
MTDYRNKLIYGGLSLDLLNALKQMNSKPSFAGFDNLIEMTKSFKNDSMIESIIKGIEVRKTFFPNTSDLSTKLSAQAKAMQVATKGISSSFSLLAKDQKLISEIIIKTLNSQAALSNSLIALSKSVQPKAYSNFNALNVALEGYSKIYLDLTTRSKNWVDLNVYRDSLKGLKEATDNLVNQAKPITIEDLNLLKTEIVDELSSAAKKTKNQKLSYLIFKIIAIISFLLQLYPINFKEKDLSNKEVLEYTEQDLNSLKSEIRDIVKQELKELQTTAEVTADVNLRKSPTVKSRSLAVVKIGQEVFVFENRTKWAFITYIDKETGDTKSGYVYNAYLKNAGSN